MVGIGAPSEFLGQCSSSPVRNRESKRNTDLSCKVYAYMQVENVEQAGTQDIINSSFVVLCLVMLAASGIF